MTRPKVPAIPPASLNVDFRSNHVRTFRSTLWRIFKTEGPHALAAAEIPATSRQYPVDVEQAMAVIEKGQQLAGHFPSADDLNRARRILTGELTPEAARIEVDAALAAIAAEEPHG